MPLRFLGEDIPTADIAYQSKLIRPAVLLRNTHADLVSCVMVSRGDINVLRHSVNCYKRQTYKNRELIIISQNITEDLKSYFESTLKEHTPFSLYGAPRGLKLGDLRNMSIARSRGSYICTWDDDDLHHEKYLEYMMGYIRSNKVAAAFLDRLTVWWPGRRQFSLSHPYVWEGSMVAHRTVIPIYPSLSKEEDTVIKNAIVRNRVFALLSAPQLYIYTVTGKNTWDESHFGSLTEREGTLNSTPAQYDEIFARLDEKYCIGEYEKHITSTCSPQYTERAIS